MAGFLYFLEETRTGQVREVLLKRGLGYVLAPGLRSCGANNGPGGVSGIVVGDRDRVESNRVKFKPEEQTWRRVRGHAGAWVGLWNDERPGPADLARKTMLDGYDIELGDGNVWQVPVAIHWEGPPITLCGRLPRVMDLDESGEWIYGDVMPAYRELWQIATEWNQVKARVSDHLHKHGDTERLDEPRLEIDWIFDKSAAVLAANYVLGPSEAALLGLFVSGRRWELLNTLIDDQGLIEILVAAASEEPEKKTDASPDTTPG